MGEKEREQKETYDKNAGKERGKYCNKRMIIGKER